MWNFSSKNESKVAGRMNAEDAGQVGRLQAYALIIAASLFGCAAVLAAIRWW